ncbi:MAG: hypothetical protein K2X86_03650 [Cytophagaceae bacterium]|nr:hypothetical protein [Cytophagaceae bacterium]
MLKDIPLYVTLLFGFTTALGVFLFLNASRNSIPAGATLMIWLVLQSGIALTGFYTVTDSLPPRFLLLVLPPLITIILLFLLPAGRAFIDKFDFRTLTYIHTVRIPVEIVLYLLFVNGKVPELMTFEGRNLDILSGISAPFIGYFGYEKKKLSKTVMLIWNFICLALLFNIVIHAVLSAPSPFQKLAFEKPNVGVLYFPFVWLPCCVVPLVLFSHVACIRELLKKQII